MRRVHRLFFTLLTVCLILQGCGGDNRTPEERIEGAVAFESQGEYEAAILELKGALSIAPDNTQARWLLGRVYLKTGETSAAVKELERSLDLGQDPETVVIPLAVALLFEKQYQQLLDQTADMANVAGDEQVRLLVLRGHANIGLNKLKEADELYDLALGLRDDDAEARLGKAQVQASEGRLEKAREWIANAVESDPTLSPAWSLLGDIEQFEDNLEAAEEAYSKAIEARPDGIHELASRALVRLSLDKVAEAAQDVGKARRLNNMSRDKQPLVFYATGQLELERNKYPQAAQAFEEMLEFEPDYLPARYYLAIAHYRQGNIEQADQGATFFRLRAPRYPGGHRLYAAIKFTQGQYDEAQEALENLLSFLPDDIWSLEMLADIAVLQGNPDDSVEEYRRIVALYPDSAEAHRKLALGLILVDAEQAREVLRERVAESGGSAETSTLVLLSYIREGEWDEAIAAAQDLVALDDNNWDAHTLLGGAYVGQGNLVAARKSLNRSLELNPGNPNAATNLARLEFREGNYSEARALYEQILKHDPEQIAPILFLNALDVRAGKETDAINRLESAVVQHPSDESLRVSLAQLYISTGQPSRVLAMLYEVKGEAAQTPGILKVQGDAQFAMGQFGAAAEAYEKIVDKVPDVASLHYLLGRCYAANGDVNKANAQLQKSMQLNPDHYAARVLRVHLLRLENKSAQASQLLAELDARDAERPEVLVEKGWLAMSQGKFTEAEAAFFHAFEQAPSNELMVQLGMARWNSGRPEDAVAGYLSWLDSNPEDETIKIHLANTYLEWGRDEKALVAFRDLHAINPDNAVILNNLAWLLRKTDPDQALEYAQQTIRLAPEWAPGLDTLGSIQLQQGENGLARRSFEQALKQSPGNPDIRHHLAQAAVGEGEVEEAVGILKAVLADPAVDFPSREEAEALLQSLQN